MASLTDQRVGLRRAEVRILVGAGAGAPIGAAFGVPLIGAFYGFEVVIGAYAIAHHIRFREVEIRSPAAKFARVAPLARVAGDQSALICATIWRPDAGHATGRQVIASQGKLTGRALQLRHAGALSLC